MHTFPGLLAAVLYAVATVLLVRRLRADTGDRRVIPSVAVAVAALVLHALALRAAIVGPAGLDLGFFNALSLATWVLVLLLVLLSLGQPVISLGVGVFPLAALVVLLDIAFSSGHAAPMLSAQPAGLQVHVLLSICAYGVLGLAAAQAIVLGIQHKLLHDHHPRRVVHVLPPLYLMETLMFRLLASGFGLLTLALASGFVFLEDMFAQHLVHKTVLSILAWGLFAALLAGHHFAGWRGPTAVRFTLGGFGLLVLGYFGSKLVLELILGLP